MSARWLNALLAAAVAVLGLLAYFRPASQPADHALTMIKASEAAGIRIERGDAQPILLVKKGDVWFMASPIAAPANPVRVRGLLAITEARSAHRLAATDLARFELERPMARVTIDGQHFDFGMVNQVSREQYVLTGDAVYTVSLGYAAALPARPDELIDKPLPAAPASRDGPTEKK